MTETLVDCGCTAHVHEDGSGIEIRYCSMHDAAADLLSAAKAALALGGKIYQSDWNRLRPRLRTVVNSAERDS